MVEPRINTLFVAGSNPAPAKNITMGVMMIKQRVKLATILHTRHRPHLSSAVAMHSAASERSAGHQCRDDRPPEPPVCAMTPCP